MERLQWHAFEGIEGCTSVNTYSQTPPCSSAVARLGARVHGRVVHENFGSLHMAQQKWDIAYDEFFAAFRSYSEAGNSSAKKCLKCVWAALI